MTQNIPSFFFFSAQVQPTYLGVDPMPKADPNASYLITGAVGGLGLIAAIILMERGAETLCVWLGLGLL